MAARADSSSAWAIHENFEMNQRNIQKPKAKLQRNPKFQAPRACSRSLEFFKFDVWSFFGAWSLVFGALCLLSLSAGASQPSVSLSGLPLFFEPQENELGTTAGFLARGQNYQFQITPISAQIGLSKAGPEQNDFSARASRITHHASESRCLQMQLLGANPYAPIHADGLLSGKMNYLIGNDPSEWRTDLPLYSRVQVDDVYPGINVIYYGNQDQLEYDFVIAPHARPDNIALHFEGVDKIEINKDGELVLSLEGNEIRFHRPVIYQEVRGVRQPISGGYQLENARTASFSVGS